MTKKLITILGITGTQVCRKSFNLLMSKSDDNIWSRVAPSLTDFSLMPDGEYAGLHATPVRPRRRSGRAEGLRSSEATMTM